MVVFCSGSEWEFRDLANDFTLISGGKLNGSSFGPYPITHYPLRDYFMISSLNNDAGRFFIQFSDAQTGAIKGEVQFTEKPLWQPYRIVNIIDSDKIEVFTKDAIRGITIE